MPTIKGFKTGSPEHRAIAESIFRPADPAPSKPVQVEDAQDQEE